MQQDPSSGRDSSLAGQEVLFLLLNPVVDYCVRVEVLTAANMKVAVFWIVAP
jgi:hypothetical protein